ncbi:MAG: hypothetical protein HY272_09290 [Gammaproteobacteria bacterium]|nr:hypothetical protein [Gammaproteobacteria bacterium]
MLLLLAGSTTIHAGTSVVDEHIVSDLFDQPRVDATELNSIRGGFSLFDRDTELQISIGIEHAAFVDGILHVSTKFEIPSLGSTAIGADELQGLTIVQSGPNNHFLASSLNDLPASVMTLVQNSLDNKTISNLNIINATVTSREWLRDMAVTSSLQDMLAASVR